jgi:hypothetical protein
MAGEEINPFEQEVTAWTFMSEVRVCEEIKNYRQKITIHMSTDKSHKDQLLTTEQITWAHTHINH